MMQMDKRGGAAKKMGCMPAMADGGMVPSKPMKMGKPTAKASMMMGAMPPMMPARMASGGLVEGEGGPTEDNIPAMLSANEFVMPADTTKAIGPEVLQAIVDATHKPSGKAAMKMGKVAMADGGDPEEARRRAEQAAAAAQPVPAPPQAPAATPPSAAGARQFDPVAYAANVASIPTGANSNNPVPAADGSQNSFLRSTELGRNLNNASNALAPLAGAAGSGALATVDKLASFGGGIGSRAVQAAGPIAVPAAGAAALLAAAAPPPPPPVAAVPAPQQVTQRPALGAAPATSAAAAAAPAETQVAPGVFRTTGPGGVPLFFDEASRGSNASLLARGAAPSAQNQRAAEQLANVELERGRRAVAYEINKENLAKEAATAQAINANTFRSAEAALAGQIKNPTERALAVEFARQQATTNFAAPDKAADRAIEAQRVAVSGRVADADVTRANAAARLSNVEGANAEAAARQLARLDNETDPAKRAKLIEDIQARTGKGQSAPKFTVTTLKGGSRLANPNDPTSPVIQEPERALAVNERTGQGQEIGPAPAAPPAPKPPDSRAKAFLKANPAMAPEYDAKYGPGASREVLGK